jgi:GT2 family glycosyltransferase
MGESNVRVEAVPDNATRADAWNAGLRASRGEYAALVGERDRLSPSALYDVASALDRAPDIDVVYSDEDRVDVSGSRRHHPHFKPDWSPDYLASCNYIGRLALMRVSTVQAVGGFVDRVSHEEWELLLRLSRAKARFRRLPLCLYHRQDEAAPVEDTGAAAIRSAHLDAIGRGPGSRQSAQPLVSIVIPNRNASAVLRTCLTGLVDETAYPHREIVIVDNGSTDAEVLEIYESLQRSGHGRVVAFNRPFNFSAACNAGATAARGELLLFLNNDIEVIHPDWLDELVRLAGRPDIGIVGAQLLYPDRTIQHAGVVFGIGLVGHIFARATPETSGIFGSAADCRNYLAVTGACQIMRRDVFDRLGGYDERFRLSFSDVILCMEAWKAGWRVVYTPFARLVHHESYTRKRDDSAEDMELLARYLKETGFVEDPYFHPELDPKSPIPAIRPPLDPMPRQIISDYVERVLAAATT